MSVVWPAQRWSSCFPIMNFATVDDLLDDGSTRIAEVSG